MINKPISYHHLGIKNNIKVDHLEVGTQSLLENKNWSQVETEDYRVGMSDDTKLNIGWWDYQILYQPMSIDLLR